ncbi:MAG TPA: YoaK family protein [Terracidiphilus sp.]|nr:YoaK family protein [Terracidiphilus sp.]
MRPAERDLLLMLLAISAGSADAWSYFGLNHSFVANMTGNTVLIGVALAGRNGDFLHPLISLLCYAAGVIAGTALTRGVTPDRIWARTVSFTLLLEAVLIALVEIAWAMLPKSSGTAMFERDVMLGCLAIAIGLQSGAMLRLSIPGIVTTYITGTWTNLMSGASRLFAAETQVLKTGKKQFEERLLLQTGVLVCYLLSAAAAGCLLRYVPSVTGALPASAVFATALYSIARL